MNIQQIFWNANEKRLRAFWRLAVQGIIIFLLAFITGLISGLIIVLLTNSNISQVGYALTSNVISIIVAGILFIVGPILGAIFIDRRDKASFGFSFTSQWWKDFGFGLLLGAVLMSIIFLIEVAFGWATVKGFWRQEGGNYPFYIGFAIVLFQYLLVGIYEETFFRGYLMTNLSEGFAFIKNQKAGLFVAYILSSSIFGILHAMNPNATVISTVNIVLAGLFLGLGFVLSGNLAISIGLHITWNFFQGTVFGFAVSGMENVISVIDSVQGGHQLITGGDFGPEAGIIGIFAMILGSALIYFWVKWQYGEVRLGIIDNFVKANPPIEETISTKEIL